jgi:hypothetical protein
MEDTSLHLYLICTTAPSIDPAQMNTGRALPRSRRRQAARPAIGQKETVWYLSILTGGGGRSW